MWMALKFNAWEPLKMYLKKLNALAHVLAPRRLKKLMTNREIVLLVSKLHKRYIHLHMSLHHPHLRPIAAHSWS